MLGHFVAFFAIFMMKFPYPYPFHPNILTLSFKLCLYKKVNLRYGSMFFYSFVVNLRHMYYINQNCKSKVIKIFFLNLHALKFIVSIDKDSLIKISFANNLFIQSSYVYLKNFSIFEIVKNFKCNDYI